MYMDLIDVVLCLAGYWLPYKPSHC